MGNNLGRGYLPGQVVRLDVGDKCDTEGHEDRLAVRRIVGETDSWGSESHCMCQECATAHDNAPEPDTSGTCEWCKCHADYLQPTRDIDEGMYGPVYDVCLDCRRKQNQQAQEELDAYDNERGY